VGRHFKWAPRFADVMESSKKAGPGYDGWAVMEGETSVTSLRANFEQPGGFEGELKL
jgi:tubulin--tyrosine ligase